MRVVLYHEAAEEELLHEVGYLELRARGLGRRFLHEVQRAERLIAEFPESGEEVRRSGIRKRVLQKFRYSLIYSLEREGLLILAVALTADAPATGWIASADAATWRAMPNPQLERTR